MSYDEGLLAKAPQVTREERQGGYDPGILAEKTTIPPVVDPEAANNHVSSSTPVQRPESAPLTKKRVPFYATTKGIVIIVAVFAAIIIAAVVGGVVGSRNHNSLKTVTTSGQGITSAQSSSVQENGPAATSIVSNGAGEAPPATSDAGGSTTAGLGTQTFGAAPTSSASI